MVDHLYFLLHPKSIQTQAEHRVLSLRRVSTWNNSRPESPFCTKKHFERPFFYLASKLIIPHHPNLQQGDFHETQHTCTHIHRERSSEMNICSSIALSRSTSRL
uniref:Predicted protein n=1 Tax=Hordeum vulgare subsp. vulgare TaxID=112509 RepID=F2EK77_HORVV|nr:predicted protein [Hordeum vulgare subsp. vulgare]